MKKCISRRISTRKNIFQKNYIYSTQIHNQSENKNLANTVSFPDVEKRGGEKDTKTKKSVRKEKIHRIGFFSIEIRAMKRYVLPCLATTQRETTKEKQTTNLFVEEGTS